MSIDLSAPRAAARKMCRDNMPVDFMGDKRMEDWTDLMAHYAVTAAAPPIEQAVREQVAAEIEAVRIQYDRTSREITHGNPSTYDQGTTDAYDFAARIARGVAS